MFMDDEEMKKLGINVDDEETTDNKMEIINEMEIEDENND